MNRCRLLLGLALLLAVPALATPDEPKLAGNWKVSYFNTAANLEVTPWIITLEEKDGKTEGKVAATRLTAYSLKSVSRDKDRLRLVFKGPQGDLQFNGLVSDKNGKLIRGTLSDENRVFPTELSFTTEDALEGKSPNRPIDVAPMKQAVDILRKPQTLRIKALQTKDPEERAKLLKEVAEAEKSAATDAAAPLQEVLTKHATSPVATEAASILIRNGIKSKATPEQIKAWVAAAGKAAANYGDLYQTEINLQLADLLVKDENLAATGLQLAQNAEKNLDANSPATLQGKVLTTLAAALRKTGDKAGAARIEARVDAINAILDREFLAKMPKLEAPAFTGRKGDSKRVAVMELFTGAECPPCVAADVAFDFLEKSFKSNDLVLLQYHMHIPGPDPLTNKDSEARFAYYGKKFPGEMRGTPSTLFNGTPKAGGGGGMANAQPKYDAYRKIIEPLLEEPAEAKLTGTATRKGDKINLNVEVTGLKNAGKDVKLRLALIEESVRYAGGNKLRIHHHVVRGFAGGVEGLDLTEANTKHQVNVDVDELRSKLVSYLDDFAQKRPFPRSDRPLSLAHLRVVAFVQNDDNREILQAIQIEVPGEK